MEGGNVWTERANYRASCWARGLSDAWFIYNGTLRFSGLSDAGCSAVTLGRAEVLEDTALRPLLIMDAIDLCD